MNEITNEEKFLKENFKDYYSKNFVDSINDINKREFGYGVFKRKIANRNMYFESATKMNSFLRDFVPLFFSYSNSYYSFPDKTPMINKGWLKSDLIYEFDADDFSEDLIVINDIQWFSKVDIDLAKKQVFNLLNFIENDFNFSLDGLKINFSGKAGYHVHLRNNEIQNLSKPARIELVDYLTGNGISYNSLGYDIDDNFFCSTRKGNWIKRINLGIKEFFKKDIKEISKITTLSKPKIKLILESKEKYYSNLDKGLLFKVDDNKSKNKIFWKNVLDKVVNENSSKIDRQTSIDINKIIRLPSTLHGDTGFIAKELTIDSLKDFNPYIDAVVFDKTNVKVFVQKAPKFSLNHLEFGPYENETVVVPKFAAIFLIGKGAKLV
ncbi:MAG: DNA primase small subunit domain-containing protein [Candidatus ainarchaeum sp.]|nr:DNA primase small subunit domain-containing protein [Candidatus ainarchaeum sp.]